MKITEIKKSAKLNLAQKYPQAVLASLIFTALIIGLDLVKDILLSLSNSPILDILYRCAYFVLYMPLTYGLISLFLDYTRNKAVKSTDFINKSFQNFSKLWKLVLRIVLKLLIVFAICIVISIIIITVLAHFIDISDANSTQYQLLTAILIIATSIAIFIVFLPYSLCLYIFADDPDKPSKDILAESKELLNGNKTKLILLYLSFIGWIFLMCAIATGIYFLIGIFDVIAIVLQIETILFTPYLMISVATFYDDLKGDVQVVEAGKEKKKK